MVTHHHRREMCASMARLLFLFAAVGPVTVRADLIPADLGVNGLVGVDLPFAPFPAGDTLALTWVPTQQRESTFPRPHPSLSAAELHTDQLEADGQIAFEVELAAEQATFPSDSRSDGKTTNGGAANTWTSGKVASTTPVLLYQGGAATSDTPTTYYLNKTVVTNRTVLGTCLPCCEEPQPGTQVCCCPPPGCAIPPSCPPPLTPPSPPPPFALSTDTTYKFRVRIYTAASATPSAWSAPASFDTAPSKEEWAAASWIGGGSELRTDLVLPPSPIKRARAYASGVGVFELHINGGKVGDHILDPGEAVYDQKVLFVGFNVTTLLKPGASNAVGARLGNSKWGYLDIYTNRTAAADQSGDSTRAFIMLLKVELEDGTKLTLTTTAAGASGASAPTSAPTWSSRHGPIVYDHLWHGEIYDARQELGSSSSSHAAAGAAATAVGVPAWNAASRASYPAGTWSEGAKLISPKVGRLYPQLMPPIRATATFSPRSIANQPNGVTLFDMGRNMAGLCTMTLTPKAATAAAPTSPMLGATLYIRLKHTEITGANGSAYNNFYPGMEFNHASPTCSMHDWYERKWYECANQTDGYIFTVPSDQTQVDAAGVLSYTPTFTYHGFRFVSVTVHAVTASSSPASASFGDSSGEERMLTAEEVAALPYTITLVAHRAHTDVAPLTSVSIEQPEGSPPSALATGLLLSQIFNATMAAHISNIYGIPTDCPQREKRGWMGDAAISSSSLQTFYDAFAFHANFIRIISDNQQKGCTNQPHTSIYGPCSKAKAPSSAAWFNGSVPDVTPFPTGPYGGNPGSTDWQVAYIIIARNMLLHYGAVSYPVLTELWGSLDLFMQYLERLSDPATGLMMQGARGDWIPPIGEMFRTPTDSIAAFYHTMCVGFMEEIATAIGRPGDAARYSSRYAANQKAYHEKFFNHHTSTERGAPTLSRCCYDSGSQTSNVMALHIGAVPPEYINETVSMLVTSIYNHQATTPDDVSGGMAATAAVEEHDHYRRSTSAAVDPRPPKPVWGAGPHLDVGIFGTTFIFETLHAYGHDAAAFALLNETTYPSFGYMISQGASTLWEAWDGDQHTIGTLGTSRNHIMFGGGVNRFLQASVGGLTVETRPRAALDNPAGLALGWQHVLVKPSPAAVRALVQGGSTRKTVRGAVSVAWARNSCGGGGSRVTAGVGAECNALFLNVTLPPGSTASVELPLDVLAASAAGATTLAPTVFYSTTSSCVLSCQDTSQVGSAACGYGLSAAKCKRRLDGEMVMSLELGAGGHHVLAVRA